MRIAISAIMDSAKSGAWHVIKNIIVELKKIDKKNKYIIYTGKDYRNDFGKMPCNFNICKIPISASQSIFNIFWHGFVLPFLLIKDKIDLLYLPWHSAAFFIKTKATMLSILDLTEYQLNNHYSKGRILYRKAMLPISSKLADKIIAISSYTKGNVIKILGVRPEKIDVVYCAVSQHFKLLKDINCREYLKIRFKIDKPFILCVGQIQHPNKNLARLLRAFSKIKINHKLKYKLVLVGKKHPSANIVYKTVDNLDLREDVIFTGYVSDKDLPYFYNAANLFVYPSLYEGFGLPVLEAMACGCPVITSNSSSLPEVTGNSAILVNPNNIDEIARAILEILSNSVKRQTMVQEGFKQVEKFSWEHSAEKLLRIFEGIKK